MSSKIYGQFVAPENDHYQNSLDPRLLLNSEIRQAGGDPSHIFELLETVIERGDWQTLPTDWGEPHATFRSFVESPFPNGIGIKADKLMNLLKLEHRFEDSPSYRERYDVLRRKVADLLTVELPLHGGDRTKEQDYNIILPSKQGTSEEYTLRRLKRDNPALAQQVIDGTLTANQAAIQAGFRKRKIQIPLDDSDSAARLLAKHYDVDELIDALNRIGGDA